MIPTIVVVVISAVGGALGVIISSAARALWEEGRRTPATPPRPIGKVTVIEDESGISVTLHNAPADVAAALRDRQLSWDADV